MVERCDMRQFTQEEIDFILDNEEKMSLKTLAEKFNCTWKEVYNAYSHEVKKDTYKKRADRTREKIAERIRAKRLKKILEGIGKLYEKTRKDKK